MRRLLVCGVVIGAALSAVARGQRPTAGPVSAIVFEGARLILSDGRAPVETVRSSWRTAGSRLSD